MALLGDSSGGAGTSGGTSGPLTRLTPSSGGWLEKQVSFDGGKTWQGTGEYVRDYSAEDAASGSGSGVKGDLGSLEYQIASGQLEETRKKGEREYEVDLKSLGIQEQGLAIQKRRDELQHEVDMGRLRVDEAQLQLTKEIEGGKLQLGKERLALDTELGRGDLELKKQTEKRQTAATYAEQFGKDPVRQALFGLGLTGGTTPQETAFRQYGLMTGGGAIQPSQPSTQVVTGEAGGAPELVQSPGPVQVTPLDQEELLKTRSLGLPQAAEGGTFTPTDPNQYLQRLRDMRYRTPDVMTPDQISQYNLPADLNRGNITGSMKPPLSGDVLAPGGDTKPPLGLSSTTPQLTGMKGVLALLRAANAAEARGDMRTAQRLKLQAQQMQYGQHPTLAGSAGAQTAQGGLAEMQAADEGSATTAFALEKALGLNPGSININERTGVSGLPPAVKAARNYLESGIPVQQLVTSGYGVGGPSGGMPAEEFLRQIMDVTPRGSLGF